MDPWHCLTSAWAYFAGTTSSSNMLMVYAFCNWHDVSIGKKPVEKKSALPEAQTHKDDKNKFIEEVDRPQVDIDTIFQATVKRALASWDPPAEGDEIDIQDMYKAFRTYLVLLWVFSNLIMVLCMMSNSDQQLCLKELPESRIWNYLLATLWGTVGLFLFRFAGSMWFLAKTSVLCCVSRR
jgi:chitin synthase